MIFLFWLNAASAMAAVAVSISLRDPIFLLVSVVFAMFAYCFRGKP